MNWIGRTFSRKTPFYRRPHITGAAASIAAALWGARAWQAHR